jgi:hypothetical protein
MTLLWIIAILVIAGYVALLAIVVLRPATPFIRRLAIVLTAAAVILAALHALSTLPLAPSWQWFLNLDSEQALGAMFSSWQEMGIALTALALALGSPGLKLWQRAYFLLMGLVFAGIALDEYFMIHERVGSAGDLGLTGRSAAHFPRRYGPPISTSRMNGQFPCPPICRRVCTPCIPGCTSGPRWSASP